MSIWLPLSTLLSQQSYCISIAKAVPCSFTLPVMHSFPLSVLKSIAYYVREYCVWDRSQAVYQNLSKVTFVPYTPPIWVLAWSFHRAQSVLHLLISLAHVKGPSFISRSQTLSLCKSYLKIHLLVKGNR